MGGNTKIMLEMINQLVDQYNFVIFTTEPETFHKNIEHIDKITVITVPFPYTRFALTTHHKEVRDVTTYYTDYFASHPLLPTDYFYSASDFAPDVLPVARLKKKYAFHWVSSLYLFIPNPIENILRGYKFPILKYIIYYFYQQYLFRVILNTFDLCLITNDSDRSHFPQQRQSNVLAMYGGVNIDQIVQAEKAHNAVQGATYDAVFCSRLHPQKGVAQLLEMWSQVLKHVPNAHLAIIGNGDPRYEKELQTLASKLNIQHAVSWLGYVNGVDKYMVYLRSKMLIHATVYDNNGMVAAEALCAGLPVAMYDLPALRDVYIDGCVKSKTKDEFIAQITQLIAEPSFLASVRPDPITVTTLREKWTWQHRIQLFQEFITTYEKSAA